MNDHPEHAFPPSEPGDTAGALTNGVSSGRDVADLPPEELLGAVDIVEAFTALRQELKLQVRTGRELQQSLRDVFQHLESRLADQQSTLQQFASRPAALAQAGLIESDGAESGRKLAEALAEIEEGLRRAVESLPAPAVGNAPALLERFDRAVRDAPWLARKLVRGLVEQVRPFIEQLIDDSQRARDAAHSTNQGFALLLKRVHRLMEQCQLARVDVLRHPFDPETMLALDMIDAPDVPAAHVAEQIRPAYLWRDTLLRCAEVRLAK